jgi:hypothetical protein
MARAPSLLIAFLVVLPLHAGSGAETKNADRRPSLADIAKANTAAWDRIQTVDVSYEIKSVIVRQGQRTENRTAGYRWCKNGTMERFRQPYPDGEIRDCILDGTTAHRWRIHGRTTDPWATVTLSPQVPRMLVQNNESLEFLQYIRLGTRSDPLTLAEVIAKWNVSLKDKQVSEAGDTLWMIHAACPTSGSNAAQGGSYVDLLVNANKGFLVQKATYCDTHSARNDAGQYVPVLHEQEVTEFRDCGGVPFPAVITHKLLGSPDREPTEDGFVATLTVTRLRVNSPLTADAFEVGIPEKAVVTQILPGGNSGKVFLWGADNKPSKEFNSSDEYEEYLDQQYRQEVKAAIQGFAGSRTVQAAFSVAALILATIAVAWNVRNNRSRTASPK